MNLQIQKEVERKKFPGGKQKILLWGSRHSTQIMSDKKNTENENTSYIVGHLTKNNERVILWTSHMAVGFGKKKYWWDTA